LGGVFLARSECEVDCAFWARFKACSTNFFDAESEVAPVEANIPNSGLNPSGKILKGIEAALGCI
jgi:hypothetical protein